MKPKTGNPDNPGLLEYLEDIIGTDIFIPDIDRLSKEYEEMKLVKMEKSDKFYH